MPSPREKLAASLEALAALQRDGFVAVRASDLTRTHRERLLRHGFLQQVMKGWYIPVRPAENVGESTAWYSAFWDFCADYLGERFGTQWCLSPVPSVLLHAGNQSVPKQLVVRAPGGRNRATDLPHGTSLFELRAPLPRARDRAEIDDLRVYSLPAALVFSGPDLFIDHPTEARAALAMIPDASDVLEILLEGGHSALAARIAGAFRNIGRSRIADDIVQAMKSAEYDVRENDPFDRPAPFAIRGRERSPHVIRQRLMWNEMREEVLRLFPAPPGKPRDIASYLDQVDDAYVTDAYHSLSIEGYHVTAEMIERVRDGRWRPEHDERDRERRDALAARGYYDAFRSVRESVEKVLRGESAGRVARDDHSTWYRQLFAPSVAAGIIRSSDLAGYRSGRVHIRNSLHAPPSREAVRDMMPLLFELLGTEEHPAVRVVLGHFVFVYIHPYADGNGRMGRFLMNVMLASGGYPWTVVPVEQCQAYMSALEAASVSQDIRPFAEFIAGLVENGVARGRRSRVPERRR